MTEHTDEFEAQYQKVYGINMGRCRPNFSRCAEEVTVSVGMSTHWKQCTRKNGHGPHGAWCKQHDPEARKAKDAASRKAWQDNYNRKNLIHDLTVERLTIIQQIADGHNDPRALCADYLTRWKEANND